MIFNIRPYGTAAVVSDTTFRVEASCLGEAEEKLARKIRNHEVDIVWKYDGVDPATIEYENRG